MLSIKCPECNQKLNSVDYNITTFIALCPGCKTTFTFDIKEAITSNKSYKDVRKPKGIDILEYENSTEIIVHHKFFKKNLGLIIIGASIFIFMLFFFQPLTLRLELLAFLIPLFFIVSGLNIRLTKTIIGIKKSTISAERKSPLRLKDHHTFFKRESIHQLFVRKRKIENDNSSSIVYDLGLETNDSSINYILLHFSSPKSLYFIETTIENILGIEDISHDQESIHLGFVPQSLSEVKDIAVEAYRNWNK